MSRSKDVTPYTSNAHNVLSTGTKLKGEISSEEDFRIDGIIEGNINCRGKIVIGQNGSVNGNIDCANIEIFGQMTGNIICSETIVLRASSILNGEIKTRTIEIEPGAKFTGTCSMMNSSNSSDFMKNSSEIEL